MTGDGLSYALLFGFEKANDSNVGYLKVGKPGEKPFYSIVPDEAEATRFADGEDAAAFAAEEDEIVDWKFHPVTRRIYGKKRKRTKPC